MTIEKHGNKYRIRERHKGQLYIISLDYKPDKRQAELLIHEKILKNDISSNLSDTFEDSALKYITVKNNVISPSTIRGYHSIIRNLSEGFKGLKTSQITAENIQAEVNNYAATHSAKSTRNMHGFISAVLGLYRPNLNINTTLPLKRKYEACTPSEGDIKRILKEVAGTDYEIAYRLGCYGLRRSELCAITSADLSGNMLTIDKAKVLNERNEWVIKSIPKTEDSQRTIYIDDKLAKLLKDKGYAFNDHPNRLNQHLHRMQRRLNLPAFRFHDLRAYYATMAHALGIPDKYIMANGGWSSPTIMDRVYKRAFSDKQIDANKRMAEHLIF